MAAVYYNDEGKWVGDGCEVSLFYAHHMNSVKTLKYRSGTVNSKSFIGKVLLRIKWKFELTYAL